MSKKLMVLALAALGVAMLALPAVASAGEWDNATKGNFTVSNEGATPIVLTNTNKETVTCTGVSGSGTWTTEQSGELANGLDFTGCTGLGFQCSSGATPGTIKTNALAFTTIYVEDNKTSPGITLKPKTGGTFATFSCFIATITVHGSINSKIEGGCANRSTYALEFASKANEGEVAWPYNTNTSTEPYDDYTVTSSAAATSTGSQDGTGTISFGGVVQTMKCT